MLRVTVQRMMQDPRFIATILVSFIAVVLSLSSLKGLWHAYSHHPSLPTQEAISPISHSANAAEVLGTYQQPLAVMATEKLTLKGIFSGADSTSGSAVIAAKGQKGKLFVVGDTLPGGATLVAVHETEVELDINGQRSSLILPEKHL